MAFLRLRDRNCEAALALSKKAIMLLLFINCDILARRVAVFLAGGLFAGVIAISGVSTAVGSDADIIYNFSKLSVENRHVTDAVCIAAI